MKIRDPKTGRIYEDINSALSSFCKIRGDNLTCKGCSFSDKYSCAGWAWSNPAEAARLMGYEVVEDEPVEDIGNRWRMADDGDGIVCPNCGKDFCTMVYEPDEFKYCPNCGKPLMLPVEYSEDVGDPAVANTDTPTTFDDTPTVSEDRPTGELVKKPRIAEVLGVDVGDPAVEPKRTCGSCDIKDKVCYTSYPPQVKCPVTGNFYFYDHECNAFDMHDEVDPPVANTDTPTDPVNHPEHYTQGGVECIDAIKAAVSGLDGIKAFCAGNAVKYIWRHHRKNGAEDLDKAIWYIKRLREEIENG